MRTLISVLCLLAASPGCATAVTRAELEETRRALEDSSRDLDAAAAQLEEANSRLAAMEEEQERARGEIELITQELRTKDTPDWAWTRAQARARALAKAKARAARADARADRRAAQARSDPTVPKEDHPIQSAEDAIECAALECTVDQEWLLRVLQADAPPQARVVPSRKDGEIQGLKFYGIRSGSALKLLGLKNGDMIRTIGGNAIHSKEDLAREIVRAKGVVEVELVRKGKPMTGTVKIK